MALFLYGLSVVLALAAATTFIGRAICLGLRTRSLRRPTPENIALAAYVGTAALTLAVGLCSHAGLSARTAAGILGIVGVALIGGVILRRQFFSIRTWRAAAIPVMLAVTAAAMVLYPLKVAGTFWFINDAPSYIAISNYLQDHGLYDACDGFERHPGLHMVIGYRGGLRMGAQFLMALTQALTPGSNGLEIFLPVAAWGVALNVMGIFLLARWGLRLSRPFAWTAAAVTAVSYNPVFFAAQGGYLPQTYGTATLVFALALLGRCVSAAQWQPGIATLVGLIYAAALSFYSEMAPVYALAAGTFLIRATWIAYRTGRTRKLLGFAGLAILSAAVLANVEVVRACIALLAQMKEYDVARVPWPRTQFYAFALGAYPYTPNALPVESLPVTIAAVAATLCLAVGIWRVIKTPRALPLFATFALLGTMGLYFCFVARDPWNGSVGNTWRIWKACKWIFPLIPPIQAAGLWVLLSRMPLRRTASTFMCISVVCAVFAASWSWHHTSAKTTRMATALFFGTNDFIPSWREFSDRMEAAGNPTICLLRNSQDKLAADVFGCLYCPRPFVDPLLKTPRATTHALFPTSDFLEAAETVPANALLLTWSGMPFAPETQRLPAGLCVVAPSSAAVVKMFAPYGPDPTSKGRYLLADHPARFDVWSPSVAKFTLSFKGGIGNGDSDVTGRRLELKAPGDVTHSLAVNDTHEYQIDLDLPEGMSEIHISCPDSGPGRPAGWLEQVRLNPTGAEVPVVAERQR